jgi:hypothetical protein
VLNAQGASQLVSGTTIQITQDISLAGLPWPNGTDVPVIVKSLVIRGRYLPALQRFTVLDFALKPQVQHALGVWLTHLAGQCRRLVRAGA